MALPGEALIQQPPGLEELPSSSRPKHRGPMCAQELHKEEESDDISDFEGEEPEGVGGKLLSGGIFNFDWGELFKNNFIFY